MRSKLATAPERKMRTPTSHVLLIKTLEDGGVKVLVVEDEIKLAALIQRGLREEGHTADVAGRGEEAIAMARASEYDAILLDVMLPGIDGFEVCRRLRTAGVWARV